MSQPNPTCSDCKGTGWVENSSLVREEYRHIVRVECRCVGFKWSVSGSLDLKKLRVLIRAHNLPASFEEQVRACFDNYSRTLNIETGDDS